MRIFDKKSWQQSVKVHSLKDVVTHSSNGVCIEGQQVSVKCHFKMPGETPFSSNGDF